MIICTNVVRRCKEICIEEYGNRFLQRGQPDLAWRLAYQCLSQRNRKINKILKPSNVRADTERPRVIHPNETTVLWTSVKTRKANMTCTCPALIENTSNGVASLQVIPTVVNLRMDVSRNFIPVKVHNHSTENITITPKTVLSSLQQVSMVVQQPDVSTVTEDMEDDFFE